MNETPRAAQAWADYLAFGPDRSLEKLAASYRERVQTAGKASVPTVRLASLEQWSRQYGWQQRLADLTAREARAVEEHAAAYRRSIMEAGYAQAHERVKTLNDLALALVDDLLTKRRRWVKDYKWLGSREAGEKVSIKRFNASEVEQLRGLLDDLAKEVGDRKQRTQTELSGPDGGPIELENHGPTDAERAGGIAAVLDAIRSRLAGPVAPANAALDAAAGAANPGVPV